MIKKSKFTKVQILLLTILFLTIFGLIGGKYYHYIKNREVGQATAKRVSANKPIAFFFNETNINSSWATMNSTLTGTIITQEVSSSIIRGGMTTFSLNSTYELNDSTGASCYTVFNSNNHVTVSTRPFLNITYTLDSCTPPVQPNNWTINLTHSCNITGYANLNLTPGGINYVDNGDVFFNNVNLTVGFFERLSGDAGTSGDIWLFNGSYILRK